MKNFILFVCILLHLRISAQSGEKQFENEIKNDSLARDLVLDGLTVKGRRQTIKHTEEGIVVSVENSEYLKSRTLDKILNISPGVSLTDDGDLFINGIQGATIVVNGKTLRLTGNSLMNYLKSISGEELKNIVIMPYATAKYDAEGNGGVLCINTKKKRDQGLSGYASSEFLHNTGNRVNESLGLTYTCGNLSVYGSYTYSFAHNYILSKSVETEDKIKYAMFNEHKSRLFRHNYKVGFDWDISPNHYIGMEYNGSAGNNKSFRGRNDTQIFSGSNMTYAIYDPSSPFKYSGPMNMAGINYIWKTDTVGSRLSVAADYTCNDDDSYDGFENHYTDMSGEEDSLVLKDHRSKENIEIYSVQADFVKVFGKNMRLTFGSKYVEVKTHYVTNFFVKKDGRDNYFVEDPDQRDNFRYTEQRIAAYAMLNFRYGRWEGNAGLRGEYTWTEADSRVQGNSKYENNDFRVFPSFFLGYDMEDGNRFSLYYGMRINRPGYVFVNPYVNYVSELYAKSGNPQLKPSISNNVAVGFTLRGKYLFALRAFFEKDAFTEYNERREDGVTLATQGNFGHCNGYGFYTNIPVNMGLWNSYNSLQVGYMETKNVTDKASTLSMSVTSNNTFEVTDWLSCQLDMKFWPRNKVMYTKNKRSFLGINLGSTCLLFNKKLSVTMSIDDIINSGKWYHSLYKYGNFERETWNRGRGRTFGVSLRYNFGFGRKAERRTKTVSGQDEQGRM